MIFGVDLSKTFGRYPTINERSVPDWSVSGVECESAIINSLIVGEVRRSGCVPAHRSVANTGGLGGLMSIISREKKPKGGGQSPQFKMRIDPALKEQLDAVAAEEGVSLASWLKELAREALRQKGVTPKG